MVVSINKKDFINREVKIKFAFIPVRLNTGQLLWLERYYYYSDFRCFWRGQYSKFDGKLDFYKKLVKNLYF